MLSDELKAKSLLAFKIMQEVDIGNRAASVSYFAMLASIPLLALTFTISAQLLPNLAVANSVGFGNVSVSELNSALGRLLPIEASNIIRGEISRIQAQPPVGLLSVGLLLSLWTASNAHRALVKAMNAVYGVRDEQPAWRSRLISLGMPLLFAAILIGALFAIVATPAIISFLELDYFAGSLMQVAQWVGIFVIVLLGFEASYRLGPRVAVSSRRLSPGSIAGASIFVATSLLFQLYVQHFNSYDKVYGSLGGAIVFLIWLWMLSACLLVGCVINRVLERESSGAESTVRQFAGRP